MNEGFISKLYTRYTLGTAGPAIDGYDIYQVAFENGKVSFTREFRGMAVLPFVKPTTWYDPYKVFMIGADNIVLRSSPEVIDSPMSDFYENLNGNHLGVFRKDAIVYLIGELTDAAKSKWYLVLIPPGAEVFGFPLYESNKFDPAGSMHYTGWIKASE